MKKTMILDKMKQLIFLFLGLIIVCAAGMEKPASERPPFHYKEIRLVQQLPKLPLDDTFSLVYDLAEKKIKLLTFTPALQVRSIEEIEDTESMNRYEKEVTSINPIGIARLPHQKHLLMALWGQRYNYPDTILVKRLNLVTRNVEHCIIECNHKEETFYNVRFFYNETVRCIVAKVLKKNQENIIEESGILFENTEIEPTRRLYELVQETDTGL